MEKLEYIKRARAGDKLARDQIIRENMPLVYSIVRRFAGRGYDLEDLGQIGAIGLIKAVDKFDVNYDVKFSTYAVPLIMGEIKRFLRDDGVIKVSRSLKENGWRIKKAQQELALELGRNPTMEEIAGELSMQREEVVMALDAVSDVDSIYKTIYQSDGNEIMLMDQLSDQKDENERIINKITLEKLLEELEEREKQLIQKRYFEEKTQIQVAEELSLSQVQ
ncbi:MAG: SigB/SigF/SigG family RNA polymerase sigma factor, partial [Eubacterium sp.]|nr:SigB/SigF/SigG family RNA polymerase sigma factor [Eubacterium sp.]